MGHHSTLSHLECSHCGEAYPADRVQTYCHPCQAPLLARYDLQAARRTLRRDQVTGRSRGLWRWHELLPVSSPDAVITLGEGDAPLLPAQRLGARIGLHYLFIKDESTQPTGTFKARGMAVAVSRAVELGVEEFVVPTAGNAGGALSAYAARAGRPAHVFMPQDAPRVNIAEVRLSGADLHLVDGLISDAGRLASRAAQERGWFDVSTLREPYRLEGKKTMGLELAQDFAWALPDAIFYPTGGGTGLIGMWKAFQELEALGWVQGPRPRMVAVQAAGCAPIVRAFERGADRAEVWQGAATFASGLRVPHPFADRLILQTLSASDGCAVAVSDDAIREAQKDMATLEGLLPAPEGAATLAGALQLLERGWLDPTARIVLYNTGTGIKYL